MKGEDRKGYLFGSLAALCWAISPVFIQKGLEGLPSTIWGTAIGSAAAAGLYWAWLHWKHPSEKALPGRRKAIFWVSAGGVAGGLGILARNLALDTTQVAIVIALAQCSALFTLILSPLLLRNDTQDRITPRIVFGVLTILTGSILIILGQNG